MNKNPTGGWSSLYYQFPKDAKELDDLIILKEMPWHIANIFKACYRFGDKNDELYELDKMAWMLGRAFKSRGKLNELIRNLKDLDKYS